MIPGFSDGSHLWNAPDVGERKFMIMFTFTKAGTANPEQGEEGFNVCLKQWNVAPHMLPPHWASFSVHTDYWDSRNCKKEKHKRVLSPRGIGIRGLRQWKVLLFPVFIMDYMTAPLLIYNHVVFTPPQCFLQGTNCLLYPTFHISYLGSALSLKTFSS